MRTANNRRPNVCWSAVKCQLFPLFKGLLTGKAGIGLSGVEGVGTGTQLPPK